MKIGTIAPGHDGRRRSTKTASAIAAAIALTLTVGALLGAHVVAGPAAGIEDRAVAAIASLLLVFVVNMAVVGIFVGGDVDLELRRLSSKTERIGDGEFDVDLESDRADELGELHDSVAEMRDSLETALTRLERQRADAREAQQRAERRNERLRADVQRLSEVIDACVAGDLDRRFDPESDVEAMGSVADSFNAMIDRLGTAVAEGRSAARSIDATATDLRASADGIEDANEEIVAGMLDIGADSTRRTEDVDAATQEVRALSAATETIASVTTDVALESERITALVEDGTATATDATEDVERTVARIEAIVETIEALDDEATQIAELLELIDEFAQQIKVLALNAAIEASRTRTGDRTNEGYDAVASEVKVLARETQEAVEVIEPRLRSIRERASASAEDVAVVDDRVREAAETIEDLSGHLTAIAEGVDLVDTRIRELERAAADQADSTEELASIVEDVATVSAETASHAQRVVTAAEETTATAGTVSSETETLNRGARRLAAVLEEFSVGADERVRDTGGGGDGGGDGDEKRGRDRDRDRDRTGNENADTNGGDTPHPARTGGENA